jgi:antitoxin ParD1/3/4
MTVKTSISLTDEQEAYDRRLVDSGRYSSLSAVLQQGLEMLRQTNEMQEAEIIALRLLIEERGKGRFINLDEGEAQTEAMLESKRKARAAL